MTYEEFKSKYQITLNEQQQAAVQKVEGPVLVLAVPGSGKTTVLVTRLGYMLYCCSIRPEEILTMTYTVSATQDMRARFSAVFGDDFSQALDFRTINSLSARIIRYYEYTQGREAFALVDEATLSKLIGEIYHQSTSNFAGESDIKSVRTMITYVKNMCLTEAEIAELKLEDVEFSPLYRQYCAVLKERKWMDYDDQMVYAFAILKRFPNILEYFQQKYHYFCVDEAQDTSKIQHLLIRLLAQKSQNLFMVGDEDQSIYGFRAAYPQALMEFDKIYPQASVLLMETNYRSTTPIVTAADQFIQQNQNRHSKHMKANHQGGAPIQQLWVANRKAQYAYLFKVAKNCQSETAVLYRDNDCALPVIDLLNRHGVGYRCRQLESGFFSHFIVRDISDIIRFAYDPTDAELFLLIYYKFNVGISKSAVQEAVKQSKASRKTVLEVLEEEADQSQWRRSQLRGLQTHLANLLQENAERAVYRIVHFMGYGEYLTKRGADQNKVQILLALAAPVSTPQELLVRLEELLGIVRNGSTDSNSSFLLSTIHSSKGLEYERVILMDVMDGILPRTAEEDMEPSSKEDLETLEEERRLFYVAMTRAKHELLLFRFKNTKQISGFAKAIFPELPKKSVPSKPAFTPQKPSRLSPEEISNITKDYSVGKRVAHKTFGAGTIDSQKGTVVTIQLDDGGTKQIDLITVLRIKALKLL